MAVSNYVSTYAVEDAAAFTYPATNGTPYWAVTQWEVSSTALPSPFGQSKAAVRFLMREDSEAGDNYILAQYAIYNTTGNLPSDGQSFFLSKLGSAITNLNRENSTRGTFFTTKNTAVRSPGTGTANMQIVKAKDGTSGWLVDQDGPYIVENLGNNIAAGETLQSTTFYIWNSVLGSDYTNSSIVSTYTTPIAPIGDKTYNKIVINGETLIDISQDTVIPNAVLASYTFHDANGISTSGTIITYSGTSGLHRSGSYITVDPGYYPSPGPSMSVSAGSWNIESDQPGNAKAINIGPSLSFGVSTSGNPKNIIVYTPSAISQTITAVINSSGYLEADTKAGYLSISGSASVPATSLDTNITGSNIKYGASIFGVPGTFTQESEITKANVDEVLAGKVFYVNGEKFTGSMPNNNNFQPTQYITSVSGSGSVISIPSGYVPGGSVTLSQSDIDLLVPSNIYQGKTILGVTGTLVPSGSIVTASADAKGFVSLDPNASASTFTPSGSINNFNQVTIEPIIATIIKTGTTTGYTLTISASEPIFSATIV